MDSCEATWRRSSPVKMHCRDLVGTQAPDSTSYQLKALLWDWSKVDCDFLNEEKHYSLITVTCFGVDQNLY